MPKFLEMEICAKTNGMVRIHITKKLSNYHKGTNHHMLFWEMIPKEHNRYHFETIQQGVLQSNRSISRRVDYQFFDSCEGFTSEGGRKLCCVNVWIKHTKRTRFCITSIFHKKLLGDDYTIKEQLPNEQQATSAQERTNVVNLDEFANSPQHFLVFINLSNIINARIACTLQLLTTILVTLGNR
jgi:hypothetical protein